MAMSPRIVWMLKASDDKYARAFADVGCDARQYEVCFSDVLSFEYVNTGDLRSALLSVQQYAVLLVTSPRASIAIARVLDAMEHVQCSAVLEGLRQVDVFCVGQATAHELEARGIACQGTECGSAEALADRIHQDEKLAERCKNQPTLFVCGDKRREILPESFRQRGLVIQELVVYQTQPVTHLETPQAGQIPDWVVFFSPSGVRAAQQTERIPWERIRKAAIGGTTASALLAIASETGLSHWRPDAVAAAPNAPALAQTIVDFDQAKAS